MTTGWIGKRSATWGLAAIGLLAVACEQAPPSATDGADSAQSVDVMTRQGLVRGTLDGSTRAYLGLPYAAPPIGNNRFRAPQPATPFLGMREASEYGAACPQLEKGKVDPSTKEDCLTLNIWTPSRLSSPRPVMVFVHGGGFTSGSGSSLTYAGGNLSAAQGVIVVTINYRLGPLGFLGHAALSAEEPARGGSGNWGLLDQQAALGWVRDNIASFGGDPGNVTLFGESAGGMSVCYQLVSPTAAGLFQRAIIQSGPCLAFAPQGQSSWEAQGAVLAKKVGCELGDPAAIRTCLRAQTVDQLLTALPQKPEVVFGDGYAWTPNVGNAVLPDVPRRLLVAGKFHPVPLIVGANKDEGTAFQILGVKLDTEADVRAVLGSVFAPPTVELVIRHYGTTPIDSQIGLKILGDAFVCDARAVARLAAAASAPTYYYNFTREFAYLVANLGAFHGAELPYIFHTPLEFVTIKPNEEAFSAQLQRYWTRFAAAGDPNFGATADGSVSWPAYSAQSDLNLTLDLATKSDTGLRKSDCDFWDTLTP